jgi:hypothetical protein
VAKGYDVLIEDINKMLKSNRVYIAALNGVFVRQRIRIFGNSSNGSKIGSYSTKKTYIGRGRQAKFVGKTKFEGGYREYKVLLGRGGGSFVNLRDTDQMLFDLGPTIISDSEFGIGFNNEINGKKKEWMEEKYGKEIFATTDQEDETFLKVLDFELNKE